MAFIQLADLIINTECIATAKLSNYTPSGGVEAVPTVNLCLMLPEGSIDGDTRPNIDRGVGIERLEFEGALALEIWNYFVRSNMAVVLFD